ncbi:MAG: hypothetical protein LUD22_01475 [Coprobacillus sp.]|nr:hypothetical protein [Coprobacillus sp.]
MKKIGLSMVACLLAVGSLTGCGGVSLQKGEEIYQKDLLIYDSSEQDYLVGVELDNADKKIEEISMSRYFADKSQYSYKNGILTIDGSYFSQQGTGEKTMTVTYTDGSVERVNVMICTKVIRNADEFQAINDNLSGTYALGNDIDLSSIPNFEPFGRFYEETDPRNEYFHGTLEGNGYTVSNAHLAYSELPGQQVQWSSKGEVYPSNSDVYYGTYSSDRYGFSEGCHVNGDNIGLFQVIGSSGVVRNVHFDNLDVTGRTIVGAVAGNIMGTLENCLVTNSSVTMATHFYDDDCNCGGVVGIISSGAVVSNVICYNTSVSMPDYYIDFGADYIGTPGNGWDHAASGDNMQLPEWIFCAVDKDAASGSGKATDSNNMPTNGVYSFVGKCWGTAINCTSSAFDVIQPELEGYTTHAASFGQTHKGENKPTSGDVDLGQITNCDVYSDEDIVKAELYTTYDTDIWDIEDGVLPSLKCPIISSYIYGE